MASLARGARVADRFLLDGPVGEGGACEVWRATDTRHGTTVALKFPRDGALPAAAGLAQLQREAQLAQRVAHPGVLQVEGPLQDGARCFLVLEWAAGGNLGRLRGAGYREITPVLARVADVLDAAHRHGVVHRDLKPGNVLFDATGNVRVADFGAAMTVGAGAGTASGSPYTASPQQLGGEPATPADDVYGLGALAYELLSGYPPFYPAPPSGAAPPPVLRARAPVPARLQSLVMAMLDPDPALRPARLADVAGELRRCADELPPASPVAVDAARSAGEAGITAAAVAVARGSPPVERRGAAARWRGVALAVAALGVVALLVLLPRPRTTVPATAAAPVAAAANGAQPAATPERLGDAARTARAAWDAALAGLLQRQAGAWAGPALADARAQADAAARDYAAGRFEAAAGTYAAATAALGAIAADAPRAYAVALREGEQALAAGQSVVARDAFQRALAIEADAEAARRGIARADALDASLRQMALAARAEAAGDRAAAELAYAQAVQLAPDFAPARDAQRRLAGERASGQSAQWLAAGEAALRAGDLDAAEQWFRRAASLQPDAVAVRSALARLGSARASAGRGARGREAAALEAREQWTAAAAEYRRLLADDATLAFAQQGLARAEARARLAATLDDFITRPARLTAGDVRAVAERALRDARAATPQGPQLQAQVRAVEELLAVAAQPVQVVLESDNGTRVTIARVGALGTFARREVTLAPGRYTVTGTRDGYRDVRHELQIAPGQQRVELTVSCTERIGPSPRQGT